jgi:alkylhydroperoxidase family enzyme
MYLLKTVPSENAPDELQPLYQWFLDTVGMVAPPFEMLSASPALQSLQAKLIGYYRDGSNLSPLLMALIRYLTAIALEMQPCVEFNAKVLAFHGMSEEQIAALQTNPAAAPLDEKEGWLLALVIKALRAPETVSQGHVEKLRELGWTDADIMDALYISCMMIGMSVMMKALKFGE